MAEGRATGELNGSAITVEQIVALSFAHETETGLAE
jgi:hypothetical protein